MTGRHRGPPASANFVTAIRILGPAAAASHLPAPENTSRPSGSVPGLARAGTARRRRRRCRCRRGDVAEQAGGTSSGQILIRGRGGIGPPAQAAGGPSRQAGYWAANRGGCMETSFAVWVDCERTMSPSARSAGRKEGLCKARTEQLRRGGGEAQATVNRRASRRRWRHARRAGRRRRRRRATTPAPCGAWPRRRGRAPCR